MLCTRPLSNSVWLLSGVSCHHSCSYDGCYTGLTQSYQRHTERPMDTHTYVDSAKHLS
jgi:hypothetical protein